MMRSSYSLKNAVASSWSAPPLMICATPTSTLRLRSGWSDGLSVKAISKTSGGRMPVPAAPCTRVHERAPLPGSDGLTIHDADTLGLTEFTVSSAKPLTTNDSRVMCSTRSPACTPRRSLAFQRASPNAPIMPRSTGTIEPPDWMNELRPLSSIHSTPPEAPNPLAMAASVCTRRWVRRVSEVDGPNALTNARS